MRLLAIAAAILMVGIWLAEPDGDQPKKEIGCVPSADADRSFSECKGRIILS